MIGRGRLISFMLVALLFMTACGGGGGGGGSSPSTTPLATTTRTLKVSMLAPSAPTTMVYAVALELLLPVGSAPSSITDPFPASTTSFDRSWSGAYFDSAKRHLVFQMVKTSGVSVGSEFLSTPIEVPDGASISMSDIVTFSPKDNLGNDISTIVSCSVALQ